MEQRSDYVVPTTPLPEGYKGVPSVVIEMFADACRQGNRDTGRQAAYTYLATTRGMDWLVWHQRDVKEALDLVEVIIKGETNG